MCLSRPMPPFRMGSVPVLSVRQKWIINNCRLLLYFMELYVGKAKLKSYLCFGPKADLLKCITR